MSIFQRFGGKLRETNEALAAVRSSWRDESATAREGSVRQKEEQLAQREAQVDKQLREIRRLEAIRSQRKYLYALCLILGTVPGFLAGSITPTSIFRDRTRSASVVVATPAEPSDASPPVKTVTMPDETSAAPAGRVRYSDPDAAAAEGRYGEGPKFNVGYYCLDVEATGKMTFEQCVGAAALGINSQRGKHL